MAQSLAEASVRYRFTPLSQGIQLEIWELTPAHAQSDQPFLFRVKYLLPNRQEATYALEDYLRNNGLGFADDVALDEGGVNHRRLLSNRETRS